MSHLDGVLACLEAMGIKTQRLVSDAVDSKGRPVVTMVKAYGPERGSTRFLFDEAGCLFCAEVAKDGPAWLGD